MATKSKSPAAATKSHGNRMLKAESTKKEAMTLEERAHSIDILAKRIQGYVQFMCQNIEGSGMSAEVMTRAVTDFHEKIIVAEQQLGRIHDELRLE